MTIKRNTRLHLLSGTLLCLATSSGLLHAVSPMPKNLGNGLADLVQQYQNSRSGIKDAQLDAVASDVSTLAIRDSKDRVLVDLYLNGRKQLEEVKSAIASADVEVTAVDHKYRKGVIEAYAPIELVTKLARTVGVNTVTLVPRPVTNVGATTSQGVVQHRVDKIPGIDGTGTRVGVMSDSFDKTTATTNGYAIDQSTKDLPGPGNPDNTAPVQVLDDPLTGATDEGRAMCQIVYDMAPKAGLAFASASAGEVRFADNIRNLANNSLGNCDVIVDDVSYFDEPFFTDGVVAQAVDDVAAAGVSYFSSAGNRPSTMAYYSDVRIVPFNKTSLAGTNLKMDTVPAPVKALLAGGLQDFDRGLSSVDVAQSISLTGNGTITFQWDEPYDTVTTISPNILQSGSGTVTVAAGGNGTTQVPFPFTGTKGQSIAITADADTSAVNPIGDVTVSLYAPDGTLVGFEDTNTVPDTLIATLPVTGTYSIRIGGFDSNPAAAGGESTGAFVYRVQNAVNNSHVYTDYNLVFFDVNGNYIATTNEDNRSTNRPIQLTTISGTATRTVQLVIGRANVPANGVRSATKLKYVWFTSGTPLEYFAYDYPVTFGHNSANGANGVAAYPFYAPYIPESFTSPGPVTIFFDSDGNTLTNPQVRQRPNLAAMDGANTTFFVSDALQDTDTFPNFFGTSAAAPHAAAIAALVLDAKGGSGSVTPAQMRSILQASTFQHDLDPYFASGVSQSTQNLSLTLSATGDGASSTDPNFFKVSFAGPGSLTNVTLNPGGVLSQAGNPTEPTSTTVGFTSSPGLVFDNSPTTGQPFVLGQLVGLGFAASDFTVSFSAPAPAPATSSQFLTISISIPENRLNNGEGFGFGVDRDESDSFGPGGAAGGNSADQLGSGVLIPQGTIVSGGMTFSGLTKSGKLFLGNFDNVIGTGYSPLDGYGFINAQAAVSAPLP